MDEKTKFTISDDKYKNQAIRFLDKGEHYELIFTDDFNVPSSGTMEGKNYTIITDVLMDMRNANHDKELHIFVGSYGGRAHALNMLFQQVLEFKHRVAINLGMADSCGWMLTFACQERYGSPYCEYMYHEMFCFEMGKISEVKNSNEFCRTWWNELLDRTDTKNVLTEGELKLGETSEVWLTGRDLISRGAIKDYSEYAKRTLPTKTDCWQVGESIYMQDGDEYVLYRKDGKKRLDYAGLVAEANKRK